MEAQGVMTGVQKGMLDCPDLLAKLKGKRLAKEHVWSPPSKLLKTQLDKALGTPPESPADSVLNTGLDQTFPRLP